jgi:uncharacterized protein (DUF4415 family)
MANRKPLTDDDGEVREWTEEDFARAKRLSDLPEEHQRVLKGIMEQSRQNKQKRVPVSLPEDVVEKMQSTGEGWEQRVEEAVREWLERHEQPRHAAS